jgi:hypothetical protein
MAALDGDETKELAQCGCRPVSNAWETTPTRVVAMKRLSPLFLDTCKRTVFADMSPYLMSMKLP